MKPLGGRVVSTPVVRGKVFVVGNSGGGSGVSVGDSLRLRATLPRGRGLRCRQFAGGQRTLSGYRGTSL
jgi:hypothetical protein